MTITVRSTITEVSDNTTNGHTIKQRVHMRAGNPALACTLCFCLPAKTNFVFDQQFDDFPIMRNISAQPPQFPGSGKFSEITNHIHNRKSRTTTGKFVNRRKQKSKWYFTGIIHVCAPHTKEKSCERKQ